MTDKTAVDLSHEGVDNILAALANAGLAVHYNETDGDTFLDIWLTDLDDTTATILSWRDNGEGWLLRTWEKFGGDTNTQQPDRKWPIAAGNAAEVARDVASILTTDEPAAGDVHQPVASHYTYGTDLDYVLDRIDEIDPIDIETEDATDADWAVHSALNHVRADIKRRLAVQAGPRGVDYCGVDGNYGRACGPDLGLPACAYHARAAERDVAGSDRPELDGGAR